VKVVWSREDDIHFGYFHAPRAIYIKAGVDGNGKPTAWLQRSVAPPIASMNSVEAVHQTFEIGMGFSNVPFDLANHRVESGPAPVHFRFGWMRSVGNIPHAFAVSSFADELAHNAGRDPKDYLLELIGEPREIDLVSQGISRNPADPKFPYDTARLRHVIERVAANANWSNRPSGGGRGFGIAAHYSFRSYVATVVEVAVDVSGGLKMPNVWTVVDCGQIIHPERVQAQFEGAQVFGASLALMGALTGSDGRIDQSNFHDYPVARIHQVPFRTHVEVVNSDAWPAGVGEPGVPPFAPALCNAIFAATGKRVRELPLIKQGFSV
jgi:isoquinoline 1-oxidoreductase beta subunit